MRIAVISDVHCDTYKLSEILEDVIAGGCRILACCGDLECSDAVDMLRETPFKTVLVHGNMDNPFLIRFIEDLGLSIHGRATELYGYSFVGIGARASKDDFRRVSEQLDLLDNTRTILVTHIPPYGTSIDVAFNGVHIGSKLIRRLVEEYSPRAVFCGHVHEAAGLDWIGETLIVNPGPVAWGRYALVDLDTLEVKLIEK